jgi:CRISPR-associated endonuclease/helicase Cas3
MRLLINELLGVASKLSKGYPERSVNIIFSAPTGYGKTVAGPLVFRELVSENVAFAQHHVMPLRAIVKDFYDGKLLKALKESQKEDEVLGLINRALRQANLDIDSIAYQMGEFIESEYARKDPFFEARYVVTTFDSYAYNLLRVPVAEMFRSLKHYVIPRTRIFLSSIFFDEAHMLLGESVDEKLYVVVRGILEYLASVKVPVILASATMSNKVVNELRGLLKDAVVIKLSNRDYKSGDQIEVFDREFVDNIVSVKWHVKTITENMVIDTAADHLSRGLNVLLFSKDVRSAVKRYRELKAVIESRGLNAELALLHAKLTRGDREKVLKVLDEKKRSRDLKKPMCLVATSVIEAGVDASFDVLIADAERVESFIQRAGRVCRNPKDGVCWGDLGEAFVYVVRENSVDLVISYINKYGDKFNPRLPFDYNGFKGYGDLLEQAPRPLTEGDEYYIRELKALLNTIYISSRTIDYILEHHGYALVRSALFEAVVLKEPVEKAKEIFVKNSLTVNANDVGKLFREGCIEGVAAVDVEFKPEKQDKGTYVISIINYTKEVQQFGDGRGKAHIDVIKILKWAVRKKGLPVLLVKSDCYSDGEGLRPWIL